MTPSGKAPPGVDEFGMEDGGPKDWKTALQMLFMAVCIVAGVALVGGMHYVLIGSVAYGILSIPYRWRWETEDSGRRIIMFSVAWPAALLLSWHIVLHEERWRKERIIWEVMET